MNAKFCGDDSCKLKATSQMSYWGLSLCVAMQPYIASLLNQMI